MIKSDFWSSLKAKRNKIKGIAIASFVPLSEDNLNQEKNLKVNLKIKKIDQKVNQKRKKIKKRNLLKNKIIKKIKIKIVLILQYLI